MPEENQATMFIRLLTQAYDAHISQGYANFSVQHKASADRFKSQQLSALNQFLSAMEPVDHVHLMAPNEPNPALNARRPTATTAHVFRRNAAFFN